MKSDSVNPAENPNKAAASSASPPTPAPDLKTISDQQTNHSLFSDFAYFFVQNKKWWLLPIVVVLVLLSLVLMLSSTAIAPFIYTVF